VVATRTQNLDDKFQSHIDSVFQLLADGGKEVVQAIDNRIADISTTVAGHGEALTRARRPDRRGKFHAVDTCRRSRRQS
jgi:hypothetical protein